MSQAAVNLNSVTDCEAIEERLKSFRADFVKRSVEKVVRLPKPVTTTLPEMKFDNRGWMVPPPEETFAEIWNDTKNHSSTKRRRVDIIKGEKDAIIVEDPKEIRKYVSFMSRPEIIREKTEGILEESKYKLRGTTQESDERSDRIKVFGRSFCGILPGHALHVRKKDGKISVLFHIKRCLVPYETDSKIPEDSAEISDFQREDQPRDEFGEVIPMVWELIDEVADHFRKQGWMEKRCLYCGAVIGPEKSDESRHLFARRDELAGRWINPECPGRAKQGENLRSPPRKIPAVKFVKVDVHPQRDIYYVE